MSGGGQGQLSSSSHLQITRDFVCHAGAGATAGSVIVTSLQNMVKNEGFKGLYHGLSPTIIAFLPNWAFLFTQRTARDDSEPLIHTIELNYMGTWRLPNLFFVSILDEADIYIIPV